MPTATTTFDLDIRLRVSDRSRCFELSVQARSDAPVLALYGPSGAGKSMTLQAVAGLLRPDQGHVRVAGRTVFDRQAAIDVPAAERRVGYLFQEHALFPYLTVRQNVAFGLTRWWRPRLRAADAERVDALLESFGLQALAQARPAALSGGQRQRVALARAIVREPNAFLMDEPLSNLDAKLRVSTRAQIKNLHHTLQTTTVYVTHDQIEAMTLADRVVVMSHGRMQQVGTPTEIYDRPANTFVAGFIGSPAMNLIAGHITSGTFRAEGMEVAGLTTPDGPVTLGYRAEDAAIAPQGQITAPVYAMELLGDATLVTVRVGSALVATKAPKDFRIDIGAPLAIAVPTAAVHLFDAKTGARL
ncbi:MAG: hypothetical protein RIQ53_3373 [Pseudomonadota bacterium]